MGITLQHDLLCSYRESFMRSQIRTSYKLTINMSVTYQEKIDYTYNSRLSRGSAIDHLNPQSQSIYALVICSCSLTLLSCITTTISYSLIWVHLCALILMIFKSRLWANGSRLHKSSKDFWNFGSATNIHGIGRKKCVQNLFLLHPLNFKVIKFQKESIEFIE